MSHRSLIVRAVILAAVWCLLAAAVVGFGYLLTHPWRTEVNGVDHPVARWFADQREPGLDPVAEAGTFLGETIVGVTVTVLVACGFALWWRSWRPVVFVVVVEAGLGGFYWLGTHADPRQRPPVRILDQGLVPDASYPSGHVATATVAAGAVVGLTWLSTRVARWWVLPVLALPALTLLSRLYEGAHNLTDVLTSLVYAGVWVAAVAALVLPGDRAAPDRDLRGPAGA